MGKTFKKIGAAFMSLSISRKILLATITSSFVTLALFTVTTVYRERAATRTQKTESLASIANIVASNAEAALSFNDPYTAAEYLESLERQSDIRKAVLYNAQGELFARYLRNKSQPVPALPDFQGERITAATISYALQIRIEGELIGTILLEADTRSLRRDLQDSLIAAILLLAAGTLLAAFIASRTQKFITRPLLELENLARTVSQDGDYASRAEKRYDDEVGSLVDSFNFMMESVEQRDRAIHDNNRDLESKVASRTAELRGAMKRAQAASKAKSDFLSTMSHELRTPMNAIVGMASLLMDKELDDEQQSYIKIIRSSSDTLLSLINDVLDYSKIESGNLELEEKPFNLLSCLEDAMDIVCAPRRGGNIDFAITVDPRLPAIICGDVTRLRQVIINLLSNAAKFTKEGRIWLNAKVDTVEESNSSYLTIEIHDTGIGIPEDRRHRLFQSFSQVDSSMTRRFGGTGLGLAISQRLAMAMGGMIEIESKVGVGSNFHFTIPIRSEDPDTLISYPSPCREEKAFTFRLDVADEQIKAHLADTLAIWGGSSDEEAPEVDLHILHISSHQTEYALEAARKAVESCKCKRRAFLSDPNLHEDLQKEFSDSVVPTPLHIVDLRQAAQKAIGQSSKVAAPAKKVEKPVATLLSGVKILLAEDNKLNQKVFKLIMKREGFTVDIAEDGAEAVAAAAQTRYDIIFMDFQMPVMDGLEACRIIRGKGDGFHQPWIIGFTANVESDAAPAMHAAGMNDYLPKPVKDQGIRDALRLFASKRGVQSDEN